MNTATAHLYETDFYGWIQNQAGMLKAGSFAGLDLKNLIEEVESMGRSEKRELESRLEVLLSHLLKWQFQPDFRGASWQATIKEQRERIAKHLKENPSLKSFIPGAFNEMYRYGTLKAVKETGIPESTFPALCPWTFEQATDPDFWPEAA